MVVWGQKSWRGINRFFCVEELPLEWMVVKNKSRTHPKMMEGDRACVKDGIPAV